MYKKDVNEDSWMIAIMGGCWQTNGRKWKRENEKEAEEKAEKVKVIFSDVVQGLNLPVEPSPNFHIECSFCSFQLAAPKLRQRGRHDREGR